MARLLYLPGGGQRRVGTLAHQIAAIVRQTSPDVLCFACLAARHGQPEHDVRAVSLILVARHGLELARRPCSACAREDEVLIAQKAA